MQRRLNKEARRLKKTSQQREAALGLPPNRYSIDDIQMQAWNIETGMKKDIEPCGKHARKFKLEAVQLVRDGQTLCPFFEQDCIDQQHKHSCNPSMGQQDCYKIRHQKVDAHDHD